MEKKIVIAFDSFKDCMSAKEACSAGADGIRIAFPNATIIQQPLSDGGEGLLNCIHDYIPNATKTSVRVHDPLNKIIEANYLIESKSHTAYMEMAAASGLMLIPKDKRNPMKTTSYGVGEMIADAILHGCTTIVVGLGGSGTCDGGEGMIKALSDLKCNTQCCKIIAACDVTNPLYGNNGAAYIFAPQKGATPEQVILLDKRLRDFAHRTEQTGIATTRLATYPGAGAAGGLGYALLAYLKAELKHGIDVVLDIVNFDKLIENAYLVITGEGKSDYQTMMGKVASGVLDRCKKQNIPVWLVSGAICDNTSILKNNFNKVISINEDDKRELQILLTKEVAVENLKLCLSKKRNPDTQYHYSCRGPFNL